MTALEAREARAQLGLTTDRLAAELGVTEPEVVAWEAEEVTVPRKLARRLTWKAAVAQHLAAMQRSGLPNCPRMTELTAAMRGRIGELSAAPRGQALEEFNAHNATLRQHLAECETCQARHEWARKNLPPLPDPPIAAWIWLLLKLLHRIARLPAWLRPAAWGGIAVGVMALVSALVGVLTDGPSLQLLLRVAEAIGMGVYGGAVAGLAYTLVRPTTRRLGRFGDYVTGIVCVWVCLAALGIPLALSTRDPDLRHATFWWIVAILGLVLGAVIGRGWFGSHAADAG